MEEVNNSMGCEICLVLGNALSATVQQRDRKDFRRLYISCVFLQPHIASCVRGTVVRQFRLNSLDEIADAVLHLPLPHT